MPQILERRAKKDSKVEYFQQPIENVRVSMCLHFDKSLLKFLHKPINCINF
jgi:hypothetical protein